jgi:uncharacterized protein
MGHALRARWEALLADLQAQQRLLIAFSAGCDSTFLLAAARRALPKENILAITAVSPSLAQEEKQAALQLAERLDAKHLLLTTDEMQNPQYTSNPSNRCFFCKNELFEKLAPWAKAYDMEMADGVNVTDLSDYRPGLKAAQAWHVQHPLQKAGLTKQEIRILSRWLKLPTWNKPASPCLSSRIPYGTPVTETVLRQIERAEKALHRENFSVVRVRHYGTQARIEVPLEEVPRLQERERWSRVERELKNAGYAEVIIDLRGFRSGNLNGPENAPAYAKSLTGGIEDL